MILKATLELKWFEANNDDFSKTPMATMEAKYKENDDTLFVLKQKWISEKGTEVWKIIPTEY
jgi:hypothetical protein